MVKAYKLEGGSILLVGDTDRPTMTFHHDFRQGGCPLKLARELEELALSIRAHAEGMGATQEGGW